MTNKKHIYDKIEQYTLRIFEGLCRQVKENTLNDVSEEATIDDIEMKIDIIMDALGLKDDDKETTSVEDTSVTVSTDIDDNMDNMDNMDKIDIGDTVEEEEEEEETEVQ